MTQLRTGKIGLNAFLHSINRADEPTCSCRRGPQTPRHIVLECRNWTDLRERLLRGAQRGTNWETLLSEPRTAIAAAKLLLQTGLLGQFLAVPAAIGMEGQPENDGI